ncbi:MAG TPA: glycosyltransferase [Spirochaetia bacterium]|nr:glycosyltransferase [Spirochaetia bacterium]
MAQERILLLYLKTGGGHLAAGRAIDQRIRELYSEKDAKVFLFDPLPEDNIVWTVLFQKGYGFTSHRFRYLWVGAYFFSTRLKFVKSIWNFLMLLIFWRSIADAVEEHEITKVVLLHCLLILPTRFALMRTRRKVATVSVVLDPFTAHDLWFQRFEGPTVIFSERLRRLAIDHFHLRPSKVHLYPLILKRDFSDGPLPPARIQELKERHGFDPGRRIVLLAGGGEGLPHGERYTEEILRSRLDVEVAVVCGKDEFMRKNVERIAKRYPGRRVHVYGFIDFMFELMNIADIIVSKGGPATVMEALMLEKPLIVSQYVYGQEKGNVEFVKRERVGFFASEPKEIVAQIERLVDDPKLYEGYKERIKALDLRNGTNEIVDFIMGYHLPEHAVVREPFSVRIRELMEANGRPRDPLKQLIASVARLSAESAARRRKL